MPDIRTVFVTGATGNQGRAVARHLIDAGFRVKALSRKPDSEKAKKAALQNVEWVKGNLFHPDSFAGQLADADALFLVLPMQRNVENEIQQGIQFINNAREKNVGHIVYSSVAGVDKHTGIPHWESKFKIENHLRASGVPFTIIRPVSLFENFLIPDVKKRIAKSKLMSPLDAQVAQYYIACDDIGKICRRIFQNPAAYAGQTINLAAEKTDNLQTAAAFSEVLGRKISYQKLPAIITWLFMGKHLYTMFDWLNRNEPQFDKDIEGIKKEFGQMVTLREWIQQNFSPS